jgi:putative ABC transport system permease protein
MIVALSIRSLGRRRSRSILALAGIVVSAALLVDMTMLASGLTRSFAELTRAQGYGLRVTPAGTLPFDSEAGIRSADRVGAVIAESPGVSGVAPVLGARLHTVVAGELSEAVSTMGIDPSAQMLYLLESGSHPQAGEVVVSRPLATAYGLVPGSALDLAAEVDVTLGRPRDVSAHRVSGIGDFIYDHANQRSLALPIEELQVMTGRPDEVSLFAVAVDPGLDEETTAAAIAARIPSVSVYSTAELMVEMDRRLLYFRQLSTILGTIALAVAALLVGTIVTIGVRERFGEIAALRAIGVSSRRIQLGIVTEGIVLTSAGCLLGAPLGWAMARWLDSILLGFPGVPARVSFFVFAPGPILVALLAIVLVGASAGVLPGLGATRTPLGRILREDAD